MKKQTIKFLKDNKAKLISLGIQAILIITMIVAITVITGKALQNDVIVDIAQQYGYLGIFVIAILSGFNLAIPIPAIAFLPFFEEVGFAFWGIIMTISAGMLIGDLIGFLLGNVGKGVIEMKSNSWMKKISHLREKHPYAPIAFLFIWAGFIPLPNELLVIPMAFMGYRLHQIMVAMFIGNIIFNTLYAYGLSRLIGLF